MSLYNLLCDVDVDVLRRPKESCFYFICFTACCCYFFFFLLLTEYILYTHTHKDAYRYLSMLYGRHNVCVPLKFTYDTKAAAAAAAAATTTQKLLNKRNY